MSQRSRNGYNFGKEGIIEKDTIPEDGIYKRCIFIHFELYISRDYPNAKAPTISRGLQGLRLTIAF